MKLLNRIGLKLIAILGCIIFGGLSFFSWRYTVVRYSWGYSAHIYEDSLLKNLLFLLVAAAVAYLTGRLAEEKLSKYIRVLTLVLSVAVCGVLFYMIPRVNAVPQADQAQVFWGTKWLVDGDFESVREYGYFKIYPFQLSFCKLQTLVFAVLGGLEESTYVAMQYVNVVLVGVTFYANAGIAGKLFGSAKAALLCALCELAFLPMFFYSFFHYGEVIGVCFSVLAISAFLTAVREEQKPWRAYVYWGLTALCLFIVCLARAFLLIAGIAMILIALLICLRGKKWLPVILACCCVLAALGGYKLWNLRIERQTGVAFSEGEPLITLVVMGLQGGTEITDNPGAYNGYNWVTYTECEGDRERITAAAADSLRERFAEWADQPSQMVQFFKSKMLNQWIEPSYWAFAATNLLQEPADWANDLWYGESHNRVYGFLNYFQSVIYLALFGYSLHLLFGDENEKNYLLVLTLIGEFLFSTAWESSSRYVYPYIVMALPCVAGSLAHFTGMAERRLLSANLPEKIFKKVSRKNT